MDDGRIRRRLSSIPLSTMQLETLNCNNCGAPLQVSESANFVTCAHCGSQLAVKRTETAHYTEVLTRLDARTTEIARGLQELKRQSELNAIDEGWQEERQKYMITPSDEAPYLPDDKHVKRDMIGYGVLGLLLLFGLGYLFYRVGASEFGPAIVLFAVVVLVIAGLGVGRNLLKAREYKRAQQAYSERRESVRRQHSGDESISDLSDREEGDY